MMDLYQDEEEEPCNAGVPIPNLEPASVLEPEPASVLELIPMPVAKPCVPTTSPGIPESSHATQEDSDDDEDIWAKALRGRGSAKKKGLGAEEKGQRQHPSWRRLWARWQWLL